MKDKQYKLCMCSNTIEEDNTAEIKTLCTPFTPEWHYEDDIIATFDNLEEALLALKDEKYIPTCEWDEGYIITEYYIDDCLEDKYYTYYNYKWDEEKEDIEIYSKDLVVYDLKN